MCVSCDEKIKQMIFSRNYDDSRNVTSHSRFVIIIKEVIPALRHYQWTISRIAERKKKSGRKETASALGLTTIR